VASKFHLKTVMKENIRQAAALAGSLIQPRWLFVCSMLFLSMRIMPSLGWRIARRACTRTRCRLGMCIHPSCIAALPLDIWLSWIFSVERNQGLPAASPCHTSPTTSTFLFVTRRFWRWWFLFNWLCVHVIIVSL
jgi:hypothetical protein